MCGVLVASTFVGLQASASAAAAKPAVNSAATPSIALGADIKPTGSQSQQQAITAFETTTGHQIAYTRDYLMWNSPFPTSYEQWLGARGTMPLISVKPQTMSGAAISWADIAAAQPGSTIYTQMKSWADEVKAFNYPIYFTFNHEPESAASNQFGTPADYIAAWQRFHSVFVAEGVTNAKFMWIMTSFAFIVPTSDPRYAWKWYPGDAYVDAIGADAYTAFTCDNPGGVWHSLAYQISGFVQFGAQHPTKPMWLPEFGVVEDANTPGRKAQWITDAQALFKTAGYNQFVGVAYYNENRPGTACDWHVSTSASSQAAFNAMAQDPFYQGTASFAAPPPTASFTSSCANLSCTFDGSASSGSAPLTDSWTFGDGGTSTQTVPSYTYGSGGTYPVTLTVTDATGATATSTQNVTVAAAGPPAASFTSACTMLSCTFDGSASTGSAPLTDSWTFGDGGTSAVTKPSHNYAAGGTYPVTLTVTDSTGATATSTQNVTVTGPSIAFVGANSTTGNSATETVKVPAAVTAGNGLVLIATNSSPVALTAPSGWTSVATTSSPTMYGAVWQRVAASKDAGTSVAVSFGAVHKGSVELLAYSGTSTSGPIQSAVGATNEKTTTTLVTPALTATGPGQVLLSYWAGRSSVATTLTPPASVTSRSAETGTGGALIVSASGDSGTSTPGGLAASVSPSVAHSLTWSVLLAPGP